MEKDSFPFKVSTTEDGRIFITQEEMGCEDNSICLSPDQIDLLIKWLQEAKAESSQSDKN